MPWRLAFALQADGWFLRSDVIWHKPNAMPESVKDRPTRAHEYFFIFTKQEKYTYDAEAVLEEAEDGGTRNRRTVWSINTSPTNGTHIASFPEALVEPCILAATKPGDFVLDPFFGCGTVGLVCKRLNRQFIGIEINPDDLDEAMGLLEREPGLLPAAHGLQPEGILSEEQACSVRAHGNKGRTDGSPARPTGGTMPGSDPKSIRDAE